MKSEIEAAKVAAENATQRANVAERAIENATQRANSAGREASIAKREAARNKTKTAKMEHKLNRNTRLLKVTLMQNVKMGQAIQEMEAMKPAFQLMWDTYNNMLAAQSISGRVTESALSAATVNNESVPLLTSSSRDLSSLQQTPSPIGSVQQIQEQALSTDSEIEDKMLDIDDDWLDVAVVPSSISANTSASSAASTSYSEQSI